MDREAREERDRTFNEMLREKYQANRGLMGAGRGITLEQLMGRSHKQEGPPEGEGEPD